MSQSQILKYIPKVERYDRIHNPTTLQQSWLRGKALDEHKILLNSWDGFNKIEPAPCSTELISPIVNGQLKIDNSRVFWFFFSYSSIPPSLYSSCTSDHRNHSTIQKHFSLIQKTLLQVTMLYEVLCSVFKFCEVKKRTTRR